MNKLLVDDYLTMFGYSWIDAQQRLRIELVAKLVCSKLDALYGSTVEYFDSQWESLALNGIHYELHEQWDEFLKNYQNDLINFKMEGKILNAEIENTI